MSSEVTYPPRAKVVATVLPVAIPVADEVAPPRVPLPPLVDFSTGSRKYVTSACLSAVLHFLLIILLGMLTVRHGSSGGLTLEASPARIREAATLEKLTVGPVRPKAVETTTSGSSTLAALAERLAPQPPQGKREAGRDAAVKAAEMRPSSTATDALLTVVGGSPFGMLEGRDGELKQLLLQDGGTPESEAAVALGLRWIAAHQREDGSWHFDHALGSFCIECTHQGTHGSTTAATGLALLPFLGAGQTHLRGEYRDTIRRGLEYLKKRMLATPLGGDLQEGTMYSQGIATLALCEAYAMTGDRELLDEPCRQAVTFIVNAQDKAGGGWRYFPGQFGDTTVTGWMLMALKSGQISYLPIPAETWKKAWDFLDAMQADSGAMYGYLGPARDNYPMTAIGLLCRMYGGWSRRNPSLVRGIQRMAKHGPSPTDLYFNYYATMVMHHYGDREWEAWNAVMRDHLVRSQGKLGHETGSWYFPDKHGDQGGRLYNTAMAVMILEVYYRHMPIYGLRALTPDFKR